MNLREAASLPENFTAAIFQNLSRIFAGVDGFEHAARERPLIEEENTVDIQQYFLANVFTWSVAVQLAAGVIAFVAAHKATGAVCSWFGHQMVLSALSEGCSYRVALSSEGFTP
ncbi:MAG: hypothetical protein P4L55_09985 [Syntrophobacteraceae bacterium]|nr:hypothetical protein [Syntrophobacteraceae bacterium]